MHENYFRTNVFESDFLIQVNNRFYLGDSDSTKQRPLYLEKVSFIKQWRYFELALGDFNLQFGKGIQFAFFKEDALGINHTLQGAFVKYLPDNFEFQVYGGRINPLNYPVALFTLDNPLINRTLLFFGGQAFYKIQKDFKIGTSYFFSSQYQHLTDFIDKQYNRIGLLISKENLLEDLDLYVESNLQISQSHTFTQTLNLPNSYGSYAGLVYTPESWKFIAEIKDYRNENFEFRRPPTLEEDFIEDQNITDVSAAKLKVEKNFNDGETRLSSSYLYAEDRVAVSPIHHGVIGIKQKGTLLTDSELKIGYRYLPNKPHIWHLDLKTKLPLGGASSIELGYRKRESIILNRNFIDLTYNFSEKFNIAFGYEHVPTNTQVMGTHFFNFGTTLRAGSFTAKAFVGQTSGGVLCSGGVCRTVPPYSGAMVETVVVF